MHLLNVPIEQINVVDAPLNRVLQLSLEEVGTEEPIRLRPCGDRYEIVNGRRRVMALRDSGYTGLVLALVETMDDTRAHVLALTLNSGTPNYMDEAEHIMSLKAEGFTNGEIARMCAFSPATVSQRIRLYERLIEPLQEKLRKGHMTYSAALEASKLPFVEQEKLLNAEGERVTQKIVDDLKSEFQDSIFAGALYSYDDPEVLPGLFLTGEQIQKLLAGTTLVLDWNQQALVISALEIEKGASDG